MKSLKPLSSTYLFNLYDKTAHLNDIMLKLIKDSVKLTEEDLTDYIGPFERRYNFPLKNKTIQNVTSGIGTGISLIGAVGAFSSSIVTGGAGVAAGISFATSAIASLTSSIANAMQSEAAIQQKLDNEARRPSSVSNTTDLNLLSYYNGNKLVLINKGATPYDNYANLVLNEKLGDVFSNVEGFT